MRTHQCKVAIFVGLFCLLTSGQINAQGPVQSLDDIADNYLSRLLDGWVADGKSVGASALVTVNGEERFFHAAGYSSIEHKRPMQRNTISSIASMTKPTAATAIMQLVAEGKIGLDEPLSKYLPKFGTVKLGNGQPPATPITLRHLLTHTSGMVTKIPDIVPRARTSWKRLRGYASLRARMDTWLEIPMTHEPGTFFNYNGEGINVISTLIETITGTDFGTYIEEHIYKPLGMDDSVFDLRADMFERLGASYNKDLNNMRPPPENWEPSPAWPAGGLFSTLDDQTRFYRMHLNNGTLDGQSILPAHIAQLMHRNHIPAEITGVKHGLGFRLFGGMVNRARSRRGAGGNRISWLSGPGYEGGYYHGGASGVFGWTDPSRGLTGVVFTTQPGSMALQAEFVMMVSDIFPQIR
jgi:CubicO group peptidase (beta-lactamase class C family)